LRPNQRIANVLRWEGIILDPVGALFAVLVFEAIVTHQQGHSLGVFALTIVVGAVIGLVVAYTLGFLLRRQLIPEYLQNYGALIAVLGAFSLSNSLAGESGLLAVTVMGIMLGNMRDVHTDHIMDFKEHLSTLLVSMLFVILAARLQWPLPPGVLWGGVAVFLVAQFVIRPISVLIATAGSQLNWRERTLISCVAPRGVVAASVTSLFALQLIDIGMAGADALVPLVFILIIGTVVLESGTVRPLARWLKVADPDPNGVMIFGSDHIARTLAQALVEQNNRVLIVDDDWDGISAARMAGLPTFYGNPSTQHAEMHMDLTGIGHLLAMSARRELNSLTCMHYRQVFGREQVYRLRVLAPSQSHDRAMLADSIQSKVLFRDDMTHSKFSQLLASGWRVKSTRLTETYTWPQYLAHNGKESILLFGVDAGGALRIASTYRELEPKTGWHITVLVSPDAPAAPPQHHMQEEPTQDGTHAVPLPDSAAAATDT
ncbi:MAG: cation:proton antiporter, partial [Sinobacteraceae bacterium]|nr:cation:proton antiporter [Nevskiaceae bacterium]